MKISYVPKKFGTKALDTIQTANEIIEEYQAAGYTLTVRQLYYQFVSRDKLANKQENYKKLADTISDARLAGMIDWEAIEDRTRNLRSLGHWGAPSDIIQACADQYKIDIWKNQKNYCEVWIEKDALVGVIEGPCEKYRVPYFACRGYSSQSEQWRAGMRSKSIIRSGRKPVILHLGDHDPSGIDMTRDNRDRISMFAGRDVTVTRLALNMTQVEQYNPPPNPAKSTDSRFEGYVSKYGDESWELDALDPKVIGDLIEDNITDLIDQAQWDTDLIQEAAGKSTLEDVYVQLRDSENSGE